ncbi:DUF1707 SHOCT-like domain-containing protein [Corynebacterium alimapuense]|nr:DUF1707 domain-containing protein [Corynebacterium alimapuense]
MNASHQYEGQNKSVRLSDAERAAAMSSLGQAFAEGRLSIEEYDNRCHTITAAQVQGELQPLFADLPALHGSPGSEVSKLYSAQEIDHAFREGRKLRLGIFGLTSIGAVAGAIALSTLTPTAWLLMLIIPTIWILLYVMKIGPTTWYVPSPRAVDKQRIRELRTAEKLRAAELRVAEQDRLSELRTKRREQTAEITNKAMDFVNKTIKKKPE